MKFNEKILHELGCEVLSPAQNEKFSAIVLNELEDRVGRHLCEELDETQLREFENIIDGNTEKNKEWLYSHFPKYEQEEDYQKLKNKGLKEEQLLNELAAAFWFRANRVGYKKIVEICQNEILSEILSYREYLLGMGRQQNRIRS